MTWLNVGYQITKITAFKLDHKTKIPKYKAQERQLKSDTNWIFHVKSNLIFKLFNDWLCIFHYHAKTVSLKTSFLFIYQVWFTRRRKPHICPVYNMYLFKGVSLDSWKVIQETYTRDDHTCALKDLLDVLNISTESS